MLHSYINDVAIGSYIISNKPSIATSPYRIGKSLTYSWAIELKPMTLMVGDGMLHHMATPKKHRSW